MSIGQELEVRDVSTLVDMTKKGGGALDGEHFVIIAFGGGHLEKQKVNR